MVKLDFLLRCLLYVAALIGTLPVLGFIDLWVRILVLLALSAGLLCDRFERYLLGSVPGTLVSMGFVAVYLFQISRGNVVESLIHILCLLLAVRLVGVKSPRNILQILMLSISILAASSLLSLEMSYLFYLVMMVFLAMSVLVLLSFVATEATPTLSLYETKLLMTVALLLPCGSLLLMLLFFVVLPRTEMPLWHFLQPPAGTSVGMTDQVAPGAVAELSENSKVAFRAETAELPPETLYWRGIVLNQLEGQVWKRSAEISQELVRDSGEGLRLEIYAEPKTDRYLVTLDRTLSISGIRHASDPDGVFRGRRIYGKKLNYALHADPDVRSRLRDPSAGYLVVPPSVSPRLRNLADELTQQAKTYQEKVGALEQFFRDQKLSYAAEDLPVTAWPIETFLFESRRGYCEYFASSFALLLRLMGVPSRLVGGYLGGRYNELGGFYLVTENFAHVWVEALDHEGLWQRIDPSRLAVNAEQSLLEQNGYGLSSLALLGDALSHLWTRAVLNFGLGQQFELLGAVAGKIRAVGKPHLSPVKVQWWLLLAVPPVFLSVWLWRSSRAGLVKAYLHQIARCSGVKQVPDNVGLFLLAERSGEPLCADFARIYGSAFYTGGTLSMTDRTKLRRIIRQLKKRKLSIDVALPVSVGNNVATRAGKLLLHQKG